LRLTVENLACRRSGRLVFEHVSFTLSPGEALVVTGRNGAGKSSLLGLLAGRLRPDGGKIRAEQTGEKTLAECLHLVAHRSALKGALTAEENLAFARDLLGDPGLSPREALDAVGLEHAAGLPVAYLSAGQKRRVALARLLVAHRPVWLLDEPTSALDAAAQDALLHLMTAHLAGGGLIVAATHAPLGIGGAKELRLAGVGGENREVADATESATEMEARTEEGALSGFRSPGGSPSTPTPPREGEGRGAP
jgi:heme exporter protein A